MASASRTAGGEDFRLQIFLPFIFLPVLVELDTTVADPKITYSVWNIDGEKAHTRECRTEKNPAAYASRLTIGVSRWP